MPPTISAALAKLSTRRGELLASSEAVLTAVGDGEITAEQQKTIDVNKTELKTVADKIKEYQVLATEFATAPAVTLDTDFPKPGARIGNARASVLDDPKRGFASLGDFGMAVHNAGPQGVNAGENLLPLHASITGTSQAVGSDGGFMVPPAFSTAIWNGISQSPDSLLSRTDNYTVEQGSDSLTFNANAETSRATGSRWGGIQAYWIAEGIQMTGSKPTLRQLKIEPQQLAVLCYATDKLLRNATAVEQWLTRAATDEINFFVGDSIINGDGVGKPIGLLNSGAIVSVAKEVGQGSATVLTENIAKMWARLHPRSRQTAVWFVNLEVEEKLDYLNISVGTGGMPVYLPPGGIADAPYGRLKGRPVVPIEYCAAAGTQGDIILADLSAYCVGLRGGVQSDMSMHLRFDYNETAFRFLFEVDGKSWLASAITPYKATANRTLSPFVTLDARP